MSVRSFGGTVMVAVRVHALVAADQTPPQRLNEVAISGHFLHSEPQSLGTLTSFFFFANAFAKPLLSSALLPTGVPLAEPAGV